MNRYKYFDDINPLLRLIKREVRIIQRITLVCFEKNENLKLFFLFICTYIRIFHLQKAPLLGTNLEKLLKSKSKVVTSI
jgi:hypothetical protein